jgi:hypothetical protein
MQVRLTASILAAFAFAASGAAFADEAASCQDAGGSFLTGTVVSAPVFQHGQFRKGVELSHTHVSLVADQDGKTYDVAIDNVYASGYDAAKTSVPAPLYTIKVNDKLELCGQLYTKGVGIHWVHSNCGDKPTPREPDGWLKKLAADGTPGPNYESNNEYCSIFK